MSGNLVQGMQHILSSLAIFSTDFVNVEGHIEVVLGLCLVLVLINVF